MMTSQSLEILTTIAEDISNPEVVKRGRGDSPLKERMDSQKKSKNKHDQTLMIKDQKVSEANQEEVIEELKTRVLNAEKKQQISEKLLSDQMKSFQEKMTEMSNLVKVLKLQVSNTQKELKLVQKSVHIAPQGEKNPNPQPPHSKQEVVPPVKQSSSEMSEEEKELKSRGEWDYGDMKGIKGWPAETQEKSIPPKKEEQFQEGVTWSEKVKKNIQPTSSNINMQRGKQPSQMSQNQYVAKVREDIRSEKISCDSLLRKDNFKAGEEIASMTIKINLTAIAQTCPADSMKKIIEKKVGIQPLSLSVISLTSCQFLYKKKDSAAFQNLLISNQVELMEAKKEDFQKKDVDRIAHLYLRGYFKELARAALQDLPAPTVQLVLTRAAEIVKSNYNNKIMQKRWMYNIQKDKIAFQPEVVEMESTNS
jgi:hypothetical protein